MQPYSLLNPIRYQRLFQHIVRIPALKTYYPLNERSGAIAKNYAPATRGTLDGTLNGGATLGQIGKIGKATGFDGVNDYFLVTPVGAMDNNVAFTYGFIVRLRAAAGAGIFPDIFRNFGQVNIELNQSSTTIQTSGGTFVTNVGTTNFTFIALTYDSTLGSNQKKGFMNGSQAFQATVSQPGASTGKVILASESEAFAPANCIMQQFFMVARAMAVDELLKLAQIASLA